MPPRAGAIGWPSPPTRISSPHGCTQHHRGAARPAGVVRHHEPQLQPGADRASCGTTWTRTASRIASAPMRPGKRPTSTPSSGRKVPAASRCPAMSIPSRWTARPGAPIRSPCAATDGRLYARGACDMKGFVAACLAAVPDIQARNLARPLHLFISYDEEAGCAGAQRLVHDLDDSGLKPALCVVGEPSGMKPILAHKGKLEPARAGARPDRPFQRAGQGGQRDPRRRRGDRLRGGGSAPAGQGRPVRGRLRPAAHHHPCRHHSGRHDPQHHPRALPSSSWSGATSRATTRMRQVERMQAYRRRDTSSRRCTRSIQPPASASRCSTPMPGMALGAGPRTDRGRQAAHRFEQRRQGELRHRGRLLPGQPASRRSSAAPATSRRRTSPTSGSRRSSSTPATRSSAAWRIALLV